MNKRTVYVMFRDSEAGNVPEGLARRIDDYPTAERVGEVERTNLSPDLHAIPVKIPIHETTRFMEACRGDDCYLVSLDKL